MFNKLSDAAQSFDADPYHALEGFRPSAVVPTLDMTFAHWTERVSVQSEFVAARELAGLPEDKLSELAQAFANAPRFKRTDKFRYAYPAAGASIGLAAVFAALHYLHPQAGGGVSLLEGLMVASIILAFVCVSAGSLLALRTAPLMMAYARVGLYVSVIDERHPWLYKARLLLNDKAAEAYRKEVLRDRGALRGADYLMMREISRAQEAVLLTRTAASVAQALQQGEPSEPGSVDVLRLPAPL